MSRGRISRGAAVLLPALLAVLAFAPALAGGFVHDDTRQIVGNPLVRGLGHLPVLWQTGVWAGAGSTSSFYRPLMLSSFALDWSCFGFDAAAWHAVQILLHAALVALFASLVLAREGSPTTALAAGLLFAAHPLNAEAAAWLSARADLLAAGLGLGGLLAHERALAARGRGRRPGMLAALWLLLALLAKESAVAFLPALLALDVVHRAPLGASALLRRHAPVLAACAVYAALRVHALGSLSGGALGASDPLFFLGAIGQALERAVLPFGLTIAPPPPGAGSTFLGGVALLGGLAALALALRRRAGALVPLVLGITSLVLAALAAARIGELGDRYLAVPLLCGAWSVASATTGLTTTPRWMALGAVGVLSLGLAVASSRHVRVYASDASLWTDAWRNNPHSARAATNLAVVALSDGDAAAARSWLERAAALESGDPAIAINRAVLAQELGEPAQARGILEALAAERPSHWPAQVRLGHLALDREDLPEAARRYELALRVHPLDAEAWAGLGVARARQGRDDEARSALARALVLDPGVQNAEALQRMLRDLETKGTP